MAAAHTMMKSTIPIATMSRTGIFPGCGAGGCPAGAWTTGVFFSGGVAGIVSGTGAEMTGNTTLSGNPMGSRLPGGDIPGMPACTGLSTGSRAGSSHHTSPLSSMSDNAGYAYPGELSGCIVLAGAGVVFFIFLAGFLARAFGLAGAGSSSGACVALPPVTPSC